ncbi:hypothetical protein B0H10DRAFT_1970470 [Mycena sp. CBHHK59/15]|nr:hypothetical protein B0H10DRAFT_1970470 [Mycena sp. CBHHK59/15]
MGGAFFAKTVQVVFYFALSSKQEWYNTDGDHFDYEEFFWTICDLRLVTSRYSKGTMTTLEFEAPIFTFVDRDGHGYGLGYEAVNPDLYLENPNPNPRVYGSITGLGYEFTSCAWYRGQPTGFRSGNLPTRDPYPPDPTREPDRGFPNMVYSEFEISIGSITPKCHQPLLVVLGTVAGSKPTADASLSGPSHLEQLKAALTTKKCSAAAAPAATTSVYSTCTCFNEIVFFSFPAFKL